MLSHRLFNLFVAIVLVIPIAIGAIGLAPSAPSEASGTFITTSTTIISETEDKFNTIVDLRSAVTYTGPLDGTSTLKGTLVIHRDESAIFHGVETFTGLVNEMPGTLTFEIVGNSDLYQAIQTTSTIMNGTGPLANLQGVLSKAGIIKDNGPVGTYTVQIKNQ